MINRLKYQHLIAGNDGKDLFVIAKGPIRLAVIYLLQKRRMATAFPYRQLPRIFSVSAAAHLVSTIDWGESEWALSDRLF